MKVLLTAFEPFGTETVNPSMQAVCRLPDEIAGASVSKLVLPVTFSGAARQVRAELRRLRPDLVISVGQAGGRDGITVERIAINMADAAIADNAGQQPRGKPVVKDGPAAYFATLPVKKMAQAMQKQGITASVSNTAGTYVCNDVMYAVLHEIAQKQYPMLAGFVHVPYLPEQTAQRPDVPSMPLEEIVRGLEVCVAAAVREATNYTYMLRCADGTLYTGWTNDLARRLRAHRSGTGAKYTKSHPSPELVYAELHLTRKRAMQRECEIKRLSREEKLRLADGWSGGVTGDKGAECAPPHGN